MGRSTVIGSCSKVMSAATCLLTRYAAARAAALSMLASLKQELGDLDRVAGWVKVLGFVKCAAGFDRTPSVVNGFSDLILELWGEAGRHARSAIGADELPLGMPVEVEAIVVLSPSAPAGADLPR
jgi:enamine deaminase RidA (YjgF/YER057c/UK114 family)